jgi:chitin synthase
MGRPLEFYFQGDPTLGEILGEIGKNGMNGMNAHRRNMFLAEDRILAFELVAKEGAKWHTKVITNSRAETDVPENMADFITQRRRWLNGTLASTVYNLLHFYRLWQSDHNLFRVILFHVQLVYNFVSLLLSWFNLATFLLTTFVVTDLSSSPPRDSNVRPFPFGDATPTFNAILQTVYIIVICWQVILAMGNRPSCQKISYFFSFLFFAFVQFYFIINVIYLVYCVIKDRTAASDGKNYGYISTFYTDIGRLTVWITCASVFGVYYGIAFIYFDPWFMFTSYPQYLFVMSSYTNIINIYAFSNAHDVSWGQKTTQKYSKRTSTTYENSVEQNNAKRLSPVVKEADEPQVDIDAHFEQTVKRALAPPFLNKNSKSANTTLEDKFRQYRTMLIALYAFSNFFLCICVMNESFDGLKFLVRHTSPLLLPLLPPSPTLLTLPRATPAPTKSGSSESGCGRHPHASYCAFSAPCIRGS